MKYRYNRRNWKKDMTVESTSTSTWEMIIKYHCRKYRYRTSTKERKEVTVERASTIERIVTMESTEKITAESTGTREREEGNHGSGTQKKGRKKSQLKL
jgi:hypothetical protein